MGIGSSVEAFGTVFRSCALSSVPVLTVLLRARRGRAGEWQVDAGEGGRRARVGLAAGPVLQGLPQGRPGVWGHLVAV